MEREIQEKEGLLQDLETPAQLKLMPMRFHKDRLIFARAGVPVIQDRNDLF